MAMLVHTINFLAILYFIKSKPLIILSVVLSCIPYYLVGAFYALKLDFSFSAHFTGTISVAYWLCNAIVGICFYNLTILYSKWE